MNNISNDNLMQLERTIQALEGINHGISSAVETESGITPMQICCMIELVSDALTETLAKLDKLL